MNDIGLHEQGIWNDGFRAGLAVHKTGKWKILPPTPEDRMEGFKWIQCSNCQLQTKIRIDFPVPPYCMWCGSDNNDPVICAECKDAGAIVRLNSGYYLTCRLMDARPIYGSKAMWCPRMESQTGSEDNECNT